MASILFYCIRSGFSGQDINYFGGIFKLLEVEQIMGALLVHIHTLLIRNGDNFLAYTFS